MNFEEMISKKNTERDLKNKELIKLKEYLNSIPDEELGLEFKELKQIAFIDKNQAIDFHIMIPHLDIMYELEKWNIDYFKNKIIKAKSKKEMTIALKQYRIFYEIFKIWLDALSSDAKDLYNSHGTMSHYSFFLETNCFTSTASDVIMLQRQGVLQFDEGDKWLEYTNKVIKLEKEAIKLNVEDLTDEELFLKIVYKTKGLEELFKYLSADN